MASLTDKTVGMTGPLSTAIPTEAENKLTQALFDELKNQNNFASSAETAKREKITAHLEAIAKEFVQIVCREQKKPEFVIQSAGARIFTFGSGRLGVYGPDSDIDSLVVGPKNVLRDDFFRLFPDLLLKSTPEGTITGLTSVPDANVPMIGFEYSGVAIDLLYSRIDALERIPDKLDLTDNAYLRGLSETDVRAVNGTRVADEMRKLVPQMKVFEYALRAIKLWAQRRAIYGNIVGFFGGVAWAMAVARVCQFYPKATASTVVMKFFQVMARWQWPQPVQLKKPDNIDLGLRVWNPAIYAPDGYHLMPIITPAYPSMSATFNVTQSTKEVMNRELKRAGFITDQIMNGKRPWKDLFSKHTFFTNGYKYYLSIISASTTKEAQQVWAGRVESRVRRLIPDLETHPSIALAHPFNKPTHRVHKCHNEEAVEKVKVGSLEYQFKDDPNEVTDLSVGPEGVVLTEGQDVTGDQKKDGDDISSFVYTTTSYIGLELHEGAKSLDLQWSVEKFKTGTKEWHMFDPELNALTVVHIRNYDLPDDVFGEGEEKPTRPVKKSKKRAAEAQNGTSKRQQTSVAAIG